VKSTWAFRRKRRPNGLIHKLKSRFVVRGNLQILDATEGTYSPVVDWSTIRLLFVLTAAQGLKTKTIDFNAAFVQSDLPKPIYLELPPGYSVPGSDKVTKSLYGDVRAAKQVSTPQLRPRRRPRLPEEYHRLLTLFSR
jgi:hypothetical protein